jgi:hypothetical protein
VVVRPWLSLPTFARAEVPAQGEGGQSAVPRGSRADFPGSRVNAGPPGRGDVRGRSADDLGFDGFFRSDHHLAVGGARGLPGSSDA